MRHCSLSNRVTSAPSGVERIGATAKRVAYRMALVACVAVLTGAALAATPVAFANVESGVTDAGRQIYIVSLIDPPLVDAMSDFSDLQNVATGAQSKSGVRTALKSAEAQTYLAMLDARQSAVLARIGGGSKAAAVPKFRYRLATNGMAIALTADEAALLRDVAGVRAVEPDGRRYLLTDAGPNWVGAPGVWNNVGARSRGEGVVVGIVDSGINHAHPSFADVGADGFNHTNPRGRQYGRCLSTPARCNDKLIGIHDFTQEGAKDGSDTTGHGSHVASTAIGNFVDSSISGPTITLPLRVSGVAPHAAVIAYKVCTKDDACAVSAILAGLDQAIADGVDVINFSIGGPARDIRTSLAANNDDVAAFLRVRNAGIVAAVSAGNSGSSPTTIASPANAPWVITAANATHDRRFVDRLFNVSGPDLAAPISFVGDGITAGLPRRPIVDAADFGFPGCAQGDDLSLPPTGASNPWPPGTFQGQIVVCRRGIQARVAKGFNVNAAGGGGMILINTESEGESINSDAHYLPAVHLGFEDGQRLLAAMAAAPAGLAGEISGTQALRDPTRADVLASSSSRGPIEGDSYLKPNISAPGTNILAAAQTGTGLATLSGTSMASPHVAGAAALIRASHPAWNVSQVESALLTSSAGGVRLQDGTTPAAFEDGGAGRLAVNIALNAGVHFPESGAVMSAAFSNGNGSGANADGEVLFGPAALNLPSIAFGSCVTRCVFFRTVRDNGGGSSWNATAEDFAPAAATVTPAAFSLAPNQSQTLRIEMRFDTAASVGTRTRGAIQLSPQGTGLSTLRMPVSVRSSLGNLPARIDLFATADGGFQDQTLSGLSTLSNPGFDTSDMVRLRTDVRSVAKDETPNDPYDLSAPGAYFVTGAVRVPVRAGGEPVQAALFADVRSSGGRDLDLYVGLDVNGNNMPDPSEELCRGISASGFEQCLVVANVPAGLSSPRAWFLVQNASSQTETATLRTAGVTFPAEPGHHDSDDLANIPREALFTATAPGVVPAGNAFPLRLSWSSSAMLPGEDWFAAMRVRASPVGAFSPPLPIFLRTGADRLARMLFTGPAPLLVRLPSLASHQGLAVDVPLGAQRFAVNVRATQSTSLRFVRGTGGAGPALSGTAGTPVAFSVDVAANQSILVDLPVWQIEPGRWFVVPVNTSTAINEVEMAVQPFTADTSAQRIPPGLFYNPARSGHGMVLSQGGPVGMVIWYAYREDTTPEFYTMQIEWPVAGASQLDAPILRFTWDGAQTRFVNVGRGALTRTGTDAYRFSWTLYGQHGNEPVFEIRDGARCPTAGGVTGDFAGTWFAPANSGYGYNLFTTTATDQELAFLYDSAGNPRWLIGQNGPFGAPQLSLMQSEGSCPLCTYRANILRPAGTLTRSFSSLDTGRIAVDVDLLPPLTGHWSVDDATARLAVSRSCNN